MFKRIHKALLILLSLLLVLLSGCTESDGSGNEITDSPKGDKNEMITDGVNLVCYTRDANRYSTHMAYSFHLAVEINGKYEPLYNNIGLCYAKGTKDSDLGAITPMALEKPYVFALKDGGWGILARRIKADGESDPSSYRKLLLFTTDDFISYEEVGLVDFKAEDTIVNFACEYNAVTCEYELFWQSPNGTSYVTRSFDITKLDRFTKNEFTQSYDFSACDADIEGAVCGNSFTVDREVAERLLKKFTFVENVSVEVPESVEASSEEELANTRVTAVYNDGSTAEKLVEWDTSKVKWDKPGEYEIEGKIKQVILKYPAAPEKADPCAIYFNGKYYFIATNELDGVGLYIRESDTVEGLFAEGIEEHLVLARNEEKQFISCFWAPEFHIINGDLYILFAVSPEGWNPQSHMMKLKAGGNPTNPADWEEPVRVKNQNGEYLSDNGITIDMTSFEANGILYLCWTKRSFSPHDTGSLLYIATADPEKPWQITSEPVLISSPLYSWENDSNTPVDEGPFALIKDDVIHLTFSGASTGDDYAVGDLKADINADLLDPASWAKTNYPLLCTEHVEGEYGPGHSSFMYDENGDIWYIYHGRDLSISKEGWSRRDTGIRALHFDFDNDPVLYLTADREILPEFRDVKTTLIIK